MSISYTYDSLKTALRDWLEEDDTEFIDNLDTIIGLGEVRLLRDLGLELFDKTTTGTFTVSQNTITRPAEVINLRTMSYVDSNGDTIYVNPRSYEYLLDFENGTDADPLYYCELNENNWLLAPTPATAHTYTLRYVARPDGLSSTTSTTWLSTNAGDLLFAACLIESESYLIDDDRLAMWRSHYMEELLPAAMLEFRSMVRRDYDV